MMTSARTPRTSGDRSDIDERRRGETQHPLREMREPEAGAGLQALLVRIAGQEAEHLPSRADIDADNSRRSPPRKPRAAANPRVATSAGAVAKGKNLTSTASPRRTPRYAVAIAHPGQQRKRDESRHRGVEMSRTRDFPHHERAPGVDQQTAARLLRVVEQSTSAHVVSASNSIQAIFMPITLEATRVMRKNSICATGG